jgi:hypothetical protein
MRTLEAAKYHSSTTPIICVVRTFYQVRSRPENDVPRVPCELGHPVLERDDLDGLPLAQHEGLPCVGADHEVATALEARVALVVVFAVVVIIVVIP